MFSMLHPDTLYTVTDLRRKDLLDTAARERRADAVDPPRPLHHVVVRVLALVAVVIGLRA